MNYIVISPFYPENFQSFTLALKAQGVNLFGIGQEPYDQLSDDLKSALTEYFRVNDLEDIDEVKRAVAFLFYKHGPIDYLESLNEYWLENDALLREQFNIPGIKPKDLKKTKLKSEMKKQFIKAGVPVVKGKVVKKVSDVSKVVKELKLPLFAKPDNGVGAADSFKLLTKQDVEDFKANWDGKTPYILEKFVDSKKICSYDGLIDAEGRIIFEASFIYNDTPFNLLANKDVFALCVQKEIEPKLRQYGQNIVKQFKYRSRFFHIEFFMTDNDYIVIEYNNRPPGGFGLDVYNYVHSIDTYKYYAQVITQQAIESCQTQNHGLSIARRDNESYAHSNEDIYNKYGNYVKAKLRMPEAFSALQGDDVYILTADSQKQVQEMLHFISKTKN